MQRHEKFLKTWQYSTQPDPAQPSHMARFSYVEVKDQAHTHTLRAWHTHSGRTYRLW